MWRLRLLWQSVVVRYYRMRRNRLQVAGQYAKATRWQRKIYAAQCRGGK